MKYAVEDRGHDTPCWIWQRALMGEGYGAAWDGSRTVLAHRLVYQTLVGLIPKGLELDHLCRVRACVNPEHLEPVTQVENIRRGAAVRLTSEQVREIRESSESTRVIGARLGVNHSYVSRLRRGHYRTDVAA